MEDQDLLAALASITNELALGFAHVNARLDALAQPAIPTGDQVPAGHVAVRPSGPRGVGKVRYWPEFSETSGETALGYASRCMRTPNPATGNPFFPPGRWGPVLSGAFQHGGLSVPEALDRALYPFDWFSQAELDNIEALAKRDAEGGDQFSPE